MFLSTLFFSPAGCSRRQQAAAGTGAPARNCRALLTSVLLLVLALPAFRTLEAEDKMPEEMSSAEGLLASTEQMIEHLILQIERQEESGETANYQHVETNRPYFSSVPNIKPINGRITSGFGMRLHPVYSRVIFHSGTDFSAPEGTKVHVTGDGVVTFSGYDRSYGQKVRVSHGYGFTTVYAHLSRSLVRQGQRVRRGEIIAFSGNTGVSTGPHLHYEIHKNNVKVNPAAYFFDDSNPDKFLTVKQPSENGSNS